MKDRSISTERADCPACLGVGRALVLSLLLAGAGALTFAEPADEARAAGTQAMRARDYTRAVAAFEEALQHDPDNLKILLDLGIARSKLQDWDGAREAYQALLAHSPGDAKALYNLGNVYFRQGAYEDAERYYHAAIEARPDYLLALYQHGWVLRQLNRPEEAEQEFNRCLALPSDTDRVRRFQTDCSFYLGTLRFREGDFGASAAIMEQVLSIFPAHPEARYYLGRSYQRLGRTQEAQEQLELHRRILRRLRSSKPIEKQEIR